MFVGINVELPYGRKYTIKKINAKLERIFATHDSQLLFFTKSFTQISRKKINVVGIIGKEYKQAVHK